MKEENLKNQYKILLFYRYCNYENPTLIMEREKAVCEVLNLKGRIIIAEEGINGTVEGRLENIEKYKKHLLSDKKLKRMPIKESVGDGKSFPRLSVKVKKEIVSTQLPKNINPNRETGKYLSPDEMKRMYEANEDFVVVDMRNDYELASGYFEKTLNIGLENSRDLQKEEVINKIKLHPAVKEGKKIVTVCTGGVRCEKMSAYLLDQGIQNVYQLHNGMHAFMEKYPGKYFKGTLFTFDDRKVMDFGGEREIIGKCFTCKNKTERYENCANQLCHKLFLVCDDCLYKNDSEKKDFFCTEECKVKHLSSVNK